MRATGVVPSRELAHAHPLPGAKRRGVGGPVLLREHCQRTGPSLAELPSGPALLTVVCSLLPRLFSAKAVGTWAPKAGGSHPPTRAGKGEQSCGQGDAIASPSPLLHWKAALGRQAGREGGVPAGHRAPSAHPGAG